MKTVLTSAVLVFLMGCATTSSKYVVHGNCQQSVAHGRYQLLRQNGTISAEGNFERGSKQGMFTFYSSKGVPIARIPYDNDVIDGTVQLTYITGEPKLEAAYRGGKLHGEKRSWYRDGNDRALYRYQDGNLVEATAQAGAGRHLSNSEAREMAERDLAADNRLYHDLEASVDNNLPSCQ